ncbi:hypothetical protein NMG60_11009378 [Bertholletia excelsa]
MSVAGISDPHKLHNKSSHRRHKSGELDVFEAARYFSGAAEFAGSFAQREEKQISYSRNGRISLDMPMRSNPVPSQAQFTEKQIAKDKKKHKQPSSPGSRLASFLNSLFNQTKKKSKSTSGDDESPGGRRRRRSSISHFRSSSVADSKTVYSSSSSGFRTPPPYAYIPTKTYKDLRSHSDHEQLVSLPKHNVNGHAKQSIASQYDVRDGKRGRECNGFSEKLKNSGNGFSDRERISNGFSEKLTNSCNGFSDRERIWDSKHQSEVKELRKLSEVDDGAESDSSSDLFELENYDLGYYPNDLPVYETTHMDSIKRGATISSGVV